MIKLSCQMEFGLVSVIGIQLMTRCRHNGGMRQFDCPQGVDSLTFI